MTTNNKVTLIKRTDFYNESKGYDVIELDKDKVFTYTVGNDTDLYIDTDIYTVSYKNEDIILESEFDTLKWIDKVELIDLLKTDLENEFTDCEDIYNIDIWELIEFIDMDRKLLEPIRKHFNTFEGSYELFKGFEHRENNNDLELYGIDGFDESDFTEEHFTLSDLKELDYVDHSDFNRSRGVLYKYTDEENILVVWAWHQGVFDALHYVPSSIKTFDEAIEYL